MRHPVVQYAIRVCIRYKHIRDTIKSCNRKQQAWGPYVHGQIEPHFQVPAIRQHYEFGWDLSASSPVIIHCVYGRYE